MGNLLRARLILAGFALWTNINIAQACSSLDPPQSREQLFKRASAVFTAHLTQTQESSAASPLDRRPIPIVEAVFRPIEVLKGKPPEDGKVRSPVYGPGNCSIPLLAGLDYLFFLYDDNFVLILPGGSQMFINIDGTEAKKMLNELRELAKQPQ